MEGGHLEDSSLAEVKPYLHREAAFEQSGKAFEYRESPGESLEREYGAFGKLPSCLQLEDWKRTKMRLDMQGPLYNDLASMLRDLELSSK